MLRWRLISAAIILAVLLALMWLDWRLILFGVSGAWLLPVLLVVCGLAAEEILDLLKAKQHRPLAAAVFLGCLLVPLAAALPILERLSGYRLNLFSPLALPALPMFALAASVVLVLVGEMARFKQPGDAIVRAALAIFAIGYIGLLSSFWVLLRLFRDNAWGMAALFSMLLIVKIADSGAYAVGRLCGRNKMTPLLSPGKTWEGTIGGIVTACVTSWLFFRFAAPWIVGSRYVEPAAWAAIAYGLLLAVAGMIGDLAESMLKRDMQRKDSSSWLRGLGGVLDIIDAPLVAGPVAWACWVLGLVGR